MERLARWLICHCIFWMDGVTKTIASKSSKFRDGTGRERVMKAIAKEHKQNLGTRNGINF